MIIDDIQRQELELNLRQWRFHPALNKTYSGHPGENVTVWLRHIERCCGRRGIPREQWIDAALAFMGEEVLTIVGPALEECKEKEEEVGWDDFKESMLLLEATIKAQSSEPQAIRNGLSNNKLITRIIGDGLVASGSSVVLPAAGIATLNAVGFTSSGVAAGSLAAGIQSVLYGGATSGAFSALQSIGATAVMASPVALVLGAGALTVGIGCKLVAARSTGNDETPSHGG
ncbi:hypothetical protein L218DRAFT_942878 [Marasmius fiardii PR-910]|nr:hypothetical protein L218DRAFT_942878 [Marasmius fiardii PR-910]